MFRGEREAGIFGFSDGLSEIMNEAEEMLGVENLKRCPIH